MYLPIDEYIVMLWIIDRQNTLYINEWNILVNKKLDWSNEKHNSIQFFAIYMQFILREYILIKAWKYISYENNTRETYN